MNSLRKAASLFTLLLLLVISVIAQNGNSWISFGPPDDPRTMKGVGFERQPGLSVVVDNAGSRGRGVLGRQQLLRQTGGVLMVSTAEPHPGLVGSRPSLRYDRARPDGKRVEVTIGGRKTYMDLFDWELKPLVEFVNSGHNGAINARNDGRAKNFMLDRAFQGRLLGLRLIQADMMPRGIIASQKYLPRDGRRNLFFLGNGERQWLGDVADVESAATTLEPLFSSNWSWWIVLTDAGERFTFSAIDDRFLISGTPFYYFWKPGRSENDVVPSESLNRQFKNSWPLLKRANPLVIRAMERSFGAAAFFRYQQQQNTADWRAFAQQVSAVSLPEVPTPRRIE